ncbi:MAG: efflux RND transporter periplasmic adaptor subunit [Maricaulaceae bacterium]|jgi:RND family efflux transporter MFP subunit
MTDDTADKLRSLAIDRSAEAPAGGKRRRAMSPYILAGAMLVLLIGASGGAWLAVRSSGPATAAAESTQVAAQSTSQSSQASTSSAPAQTSSPVRGGRLVASGYVTARRQATASAEITGRIVEVLVEEGDVVEEGQILGRLDSVRAEIDLELAEASALAAEAAQDRIAADLREARRVLDRTQRLSESSVYSEAEMTANRARVESLEAQLRGAEAQTNIARLQVDRQRDFVDRHLVRAPFPGVVVAKNAQAGEIVSPASAGGGFTRTGIATVVDMDSLEIEVDVNESSINQVSADQPVEAVLDAYPDWRIPSHVIAIIPTADRSRATIQVRVGFDELDPRILPDMAARVTFLED